MSSVETALPVAVKLISVSTVLFTIVGARAARADDHAWKPRRHYRRLDERIDDDWADQAILVSIDLQFHGNQCSESISMGIG